MLPKEAGDLWDALAAFDDDTRQALFAHCVASSVNAVFEAYNRKPKALAHADRLAQAVELDMVSAGWTPSVDNYLSRVTKARIVAAVGEAKGAQPALSDTGERLSASDGDRIVRLVAHHVGAEVHAASPRVSAELPGTGERFEGLLPPVVAAPCFAIRKPAVAVFTLEDYVVAGIMPANAAGALAKAAPSMPAPPSARCAGSNSLSKRRS